MAEVLQDLNAKKAKPENNIPIKLVEEDIELFSSALWRMFNFVLTKHLFQIA